MAVCYAGALLSGCKDKDKNTYIDIDSDYQLQDSELAEKLEHASEPLNTVITDYEAHSNIKKMIMPAVAHCTISDKYFYSYMGMGYSPFQSAWTGSDITQLYKINLQSGEVIPMCDTPGCTHEMELYPDCVCNKYDYISPTAVGDAIWFCRNRKLIELKDGKETVLYENDYCTEFEEQLLKEYPDQKYSFDVTLGGDGDYIYAFGASYTFRINRNTMKPEQYIKITDDQISSRFVYGNKAYITDMLQELFVIDYESGEATKLGDKINNVAAYDDVLYYTRYNDGEPILYTAELDGSGEKQLLTDCYMDFFVKDGKVVYHNNTGNEALHIYDLSTGEDKVIYDDWERCIGILTADHIDRIFAIGMINKKAEDTLADQEGTHDVVVSVRSDGSDLWVKEIDGSKDIM